MILGAHLMQQAVGQRHGLVLPPQRVSAGTCRLFCTVRKALETPHMS